jgi:arsenate reductase-like glutaredoxin family protein
MKTRQEWIEIYAHDYRDMTLSQVDLEKMLTDFVQETDKLCREDTIKMVMSRIDSHGFYEFVTPKGEQLDK